MAEFIFLVLLECPSAKRATADRSSSQSVAVFSSVCLGVSALSCKHYLISLKIRNFLSYLCVVYMFVILSLLINVIKRQIKDVVQPLSRKRAEHLLIPYTRQERLREDGPLSPSVLLAPRQRRRKERKREEGKTTPSLRRRHLSK